MSPAQYRKWRFYAESLIDQAITILDAIDGDADLEDGGDGEPSPPPPLAGRANCAGVPAAMMMERRLFSQRPNAWPACLVRKC